MATVTVPIERFRRGDLAGTCAVSGVPAANVFALRAGQTVGAIPINGAVAASITRVQSMTKLAAALALFVVLLALTFKSWMLAQFVLIPVSIAGGLTWGNRRRIPAAKEHDGEVELTRVHPQFATAVTSGADKCSGCVNEGGCSVAEKADCAATSS